MAKTKDESPPEAPSREFSLKDVISAPIHKPPRVVLYGVHGIGKSTWSSKSPSPILIPTEDGADEIGVARFPKAESAEDVIACLRLLYKEGHPYKTVIIDSADWLEDFIFGMLKTQFTDKELAYGKEALKAEERLSDVLTALNYLRERKGMTCILLAHSEIKRFDSPLTEPFDRYQPKLQQRLSSLLQEWADAVLFATYDLSVKREDVGFNKQVRRGISAGDRIVYTEERPAFYAKNRYALPEELPLDWNEFASRVPYFQQPAK
jgi:hypothetical protein